MSAVKYDQKKPPMDLLPYESLEAIAEVLGFGAKKYARGNWLKGIEYSRLISAAQRHLGQFNAGQDLDEESGLSHIAHAGCCVLFLLYMIKHRKDLDDRCFKAEVPKAKRPKIKFKVGGKYRTRGGQIVSCIELLEPKDYPGVAATTINGWHAHLADGKSIIDEDRYDIVEELP